MKPLEDCRQRDITDDQSGSIQACLCYTDFCNDAQINLQPHLTNQELPRTQSRSWSSPKRAPSRLCPPGFDLVGGDCYFLSSDRLGWVGARKQCQARGAQLLSLQEEQKRKSLADHITRASR